MLFVSSRGWRLRVQDILAAITGIQRFVAGKTLEDVEADEIIVRAVLYNFVVIGEASRKIPVELQSRFPEVPWRLMNDMRNVVTHEYFQVDIQRVWATIQDDLPLLVPQLQELLEQQMEE